MTPSRPARYKKIEQLCLWLLVLLVAGFLLVALMEPGNPLVFDSEPIMAFNEDWFLADENGRPTAPAPELPAKIPESGPLRLTKVLPSDLPQPLVLCFRTAHQRVRLYCDNALIYSFGYDQLPRFGISPGGAWNLVRLPADSAEKTLLLELDAPYPSYQGRVETFSVGSKAALLLDLLARHMFSLLLTMVIFFAGTVMLLGYGLVIRKDGSTTKEMLYLGFFSIFVALWMFGESRLTQFFGTPPAFNTFLTIVAMLATPIPLVKYIACSCRPSGRKILHIAGNLLCLLLAGSVLLQAFTLVDFIAQLKVLNILFLLLCAVILFVVLSDLVRQPNRGTLRLSFSLLVLALFFLLETIQLYTARNLVGGLMRVGVLSFISLQAQMAFKNATRIMRMSRLASVDTLTGCLNRNAYSQTLSDLDKQPGVGVVIADINDLKLINDTYGHAAGDDAIVRCALAFSEVFGPLGQCFRIGGDEFAMLGPGLTQQTLQAALPRFEQLVHDSAAQTAYPFSISCGLTLYDAQQDLTLADAVRRADKLMYHNKRRYKQEEGAPCPPIED